MKIIVVDLQYAPNAIVIEKLTVKAFQLWQLSIGNKIGKVKVAAK